MAHVSCCKAFPQSAERRPPAFAIHHYTAWSMSNEDLTIEQGASLTPVHGSPVPSPVDGGDRDETFPLQVCTMMSACWCTCMQSELRCIVWVKV